VFGSHAAVATPQLTGVAPRVRQLLHDASVAIRELIGVAALFAARASDDVSEIDRREIAKHDAFLSCVRGGVSAAPVPVDFASRVVRPARIEPSRSTTAEGAGN
jgi:hypothetical protein